MALPIQINASQISGVHSIMSAVNQLGYVGIVSTNLAAWERFAVDLLGMQVGRRSDRQLTLRMDERMQRFIIDQGSEDDLSFSGFECATEGDLLALVDKLRGAGLAVEEAGAPQAAERAVARLFLTRDPDGNGVELYFGPVVSSQPFHSTVLRSRFVTGAQGLGHYFLIAKQDRQTTLDFYVGLLGFKLSDYIRQELAPGVVADAAFLHCNGRHHTMAAAVLPHPKRIHHLMVEVADMSDVGYAYDRCMDAKQPFEMTLGMHPNDHMFSFYVTTPAGFSIEFGWGGLQVDDATWSVKSFDRLSSWGHRPPAMVAAALV